MIAEAKHLTIAELEEGLDKIRQSPKQNGTLALLVRRPQTETREILEEGELSLTEGLVGDNWKTRGIGSSPNWSPNIETQLTVMNARAIAHIAQDKDRWHLAGDQLFVDFDISEDNLPTGTKLSIGSAMIEVTAEPHNGCKKFVSRFGLDAMHFVNSPVGKQLHLRGINAKVVQPGIIRVGDVVKKI